MKFVYVALTLFAVAAITLTGCGTSEEAFSNVRVLTPWGTIDTTTSGTSEIDLRGIMQEQAPAKSYNLDLQQLEK